jgi:hypothetical protein
VIRPPAPDEVAATTSRTADLLQDLLVSTPREASVIAAERRNALAAAERQWHRDRAQAETRWSRFHTKWTCQWGRHGRRGGSYTLPSSWKQQLNAWHTAGLSLEVACVLMDDAMVLEAEELALDETGAPSRWATFLVLVARTIDHLTEQAQQPSRSPLQRAQGG